MQKCVVCFLPARRSKHGTCYGNVSGWVGGSPSHASIVSKRLNLSEKVFDHLKASSFYFLETHAPIHNSTGNPFSGGVKYTGVGKIGNFMCDFQRTSLFMSETVRDMPTVAMER